MKPEDLDRLMLVPTGGEPIPAHIAFRTVLRWLLWGEGASLKASGRQWPRPSAARLIVEEEEARRFGLRFLGAGRVSNTLWLPNAVGAKPIGPRGGLHLRVQASEDLPDHSSLRPGLGEITLDFPGVILAAVRWRCLTHEDCQENPELGAACEAAKAAGSRRLKSGRR